MQERVHWTVTNKNIYKNYISQTYNIFKPENKLIRIYPIFHFIPGEPDAITARRKDKRTHLLNTTPNNEYANIIMDDSFKASDDTRLYRIGIASHAYIDTWAHQNFVGCFDDFNHIAIDPKPNIGHADAEAHPDWVAHIWNDDRLIKKQIYNSKRFIEAAENLFKKFCHYQLITNKIDNSNKLCNIIETLKSWQGREYKGIINKNHHKRIKKYLTHMKWLEKYNHTKWFYEAIDEKIRFFKDSHNGILKLLNLFKDIYYWKENIDIEKTHYYCFQEAVKDHQKLGLLILNDRFKKSGLNLRKEF